MAKGWGLGSMHSLSSDFVASRLLPGSFVV